MLMSELADNGGRVCVVSECRTQSEAGRNCTNTLLDDGNGAKRSSLVQRAAAWRSCGASELIIFG